VDAERRLFGRYGVDYDSRQLRLADPAAWAPVMAHLRDRRSIAIDLPGFGLSDAYSYAGRALRAHASAQLTSVLDAMALDRAALVGTSLGGMWALCVAVDAPHRVRALSCGTQLPASARGTGSTRRCAGTGSLPDAASAWRGGQPVLGVA
jgi:pimeloyl-ACP methyl ester carboxylesterase